jgi:hypothetical protein
MSAGGYPEHLTDPDEIDRWLERRDSRQGSEQVTAMFDADVELATVLTRLGARSNTGPRPEVADSITACMEFQRRALPVRWWLVFTGKAPTGWRTPDKVPWR